MSPVNVHEAKTHLSRLLQRVARGEEIVIARSGEPVAKLVPYAAPQREPGRLRGKIRIAPDFDAPLPEEIARAFRGEGE
jgi:prevent-host-death family protein